MHVRTATAEDASAIRRVHRDAILELGPEAYSDRQVEAWAGGVDDAEDADYAAVITDDSMAYIVAEIDDEVVAFGSLCVDAPEDYGASVDGEVTGVYVHSSVARSGVGTAVITELERRAQDHGLGAVGLEASLNAVPFYEAHGYERVRELRHEFSAPSGVEGTVVEMRKVL
ncbi:GNAT family N-acetyltransferase [Haloarchaeobius sp. DFWS5]|uniref:GNAT family N-acetyltransferase n=1 Tax=Haloarchaeobius sp. DFWS5 TaxID=3446114 RepID=UPI003EBAA3CB